MLGAEDLTSVRIELVESPRSQASKIAEPTSLAAAVICGADADYATVVPDLAASLRAAGARAVWVAGRPPDPDTAAAWRSAGVTDFVYLGCEARALLSRLHTTLGVSA